MPRHEWNMRTRFRKPRAATSYQLGKGLIGRITGIWALPCPGLTCRDQLRLFTIT
jgi:hypothetical protein